MAVTPPVEPVILAVPNVAELIVDTLTDSVPMVAVPVDAVMLDPNVMAPS